MEVGRVNKTLYLLNYIDDEGLPASGYSLSSTGEKDAMQWLEPLLRTTW